MRHLDLHKPAAEPVLADTLRGQLAVWPGSAAAPVELRGIAQALPERLSAPVHLRGAVGHHLHLGTSHAVWLVQVQTPSALPELSPVLQLELVRQSLAVPAHVTAISAATVSSGSHALPRMAGTATLEVATTRG